MKRDFRITEKDMLDTRHFPISAIFNSIPDDTFIRTITPLGDGSGFGVEYGACVFPNDLDEYEITTSGIFEGVQFGLHNGEEIVVDYPTFYYYLDIVCSIYLEDYPKDSEKIKEILSKTKQTLRL